MECLELSQDVVVKEKGQKIRKPLKIPKKRRYEDSDPDLEQFKRPCKHEGPSYFCDKVTLDDIKYNKSNIYKTADKSEQEVKLCHLISSCPTYRKRSVKEQPKKRLISVIYYLKSKKKKELIRVCQQFFMKSLGLTIRRLNRVGNIINDGNVPKEKRGGDRKSSKTLDKKNSIREYIGNLKGKESHYNRAKSQRIYLGSELSISKLHKLYNSKCDARMQCSLSMFARIFRKDFNLGFSSPASDCCGTCMRLKHQIKMESDKQKKNTMIMQYRIHTRRAKAFYELTKEKIDSSLTFCFDLQQVQPLPRTPISDAFYSHQISFYVFCCVDMQSKNPTFFTWTEDLAGRGSVQIGSALLNHLDSLTLDGIKILRLFCDGCGGQNKNSHIIHALYFWLKFKAPAHVREIRITYPVRGHSFLPADRVFGRVEKSLRKIPFVKSKLEYKNIYSNFGVVKELGTDWDLYDIKSLESTLKKIEGISDLKRIYLMKEEIKKKTTIKVVVFQNFRFESLTETPKNLIKRGKTDLNLRLEKLALNNAIPEKKKKSLKHLMDEQFGPEWMDDQQFSWYRNLLSDNVQILEREEAEEHEQCDCLEPDHGVHI